MTIRTKTYLLLVSACAAGPTLFAQVASTPSTATEKTTAAAVGTAKADEEVVVLSPFEVSAAKDTGYVATETLAGSRIRTDLRDVGSAISVVTKEFMQDVGATDNATLLQYTTNTEVGGTHGNYEGKGNGTTIYDSTPINTSQRVRGLSAADQTRDFFTTDIPWDGFNVDRIDIQRGPNAMLYGLGSPSGIINASTRNANFRDSGIAEARVGSYGASRVSLDVNKNLIDNVLALRVDGLYNRQRFQQKQAYQNDKRVYGTIRWDPKFFGKDFATDVKMRIEQGRITANLPRTMAPYDSFTPWFTSANKLTIDQAGNTAGNYTLYDLSSTASVTDRKSVV